MIKRSLIYRLIKYLLAFLGNLIEKSINFLIHQRIKNNRPNFCKHGHALILFLKSIVLYRQGMHTNFFPNVFNWRLVARALHIFNHLQISLTFNLWTVYVVPGAAQRDRFIGLFQRSRCKNGIALDYFHLKACSWSGNLPAF